MTSFRDAVAIVTGGASGIGKALGRELLGRGARVVLADINSSLLEKTARELDGARAETLDVTDSAAVRALVTDTVEREGRLDYMFNNAGIAVMGESNDLSVDDWDRVIDVNVKGVIYGTLAAYDAMLEQGSGHIVNTASIAGLLPSPGLAAYSASKHAVVGLSKTLRIEAEARGVKVSAVCPGIIDTPMARSPELVNLDLSTVQAQMDKAPINPYSPDDCAKDILAGVAENRPVIIVTDHGKLMVRAAKWAPGLFRRFLVKQLEKSRAEHAAAQTK